MGWYKVLEGKSGSILAQWRELSERKLSLDDYARAMTALADEQFGIAPDAADDWGMGAWEKADLMSRVRTLQSRLEALERKVAELGARQ